MSVETLQHLEDLVASKGWQWFLDQHDKTWGPAAFLNTLAVIQQNPQLTNDEKHAQAQVAWAARDSVTKMVRRPYEEIATNRRAHQQSDTSGPSRRGPGL